MKHTRAGWLLVLGALVASTGCKSTLSVDFDEAYGSRGVDRTAPFLGVVVDRADPGDPEGVMVRRIIQDTPAEWAGLQPGDVLLRIGAQRVRTDGELKSALARHEDVVVEHYGRSLSEVEEDPEWAVLKAEFGLSDDDPDDELAEMREEAAAARGGQLELTLRRRDEVVIVPVTLRRRGEHERLAKLALSLAVEQQKDEVSIPFLFDSEEKAIPPELWLAYRGQRVTEPIVVYSDFDLVPVLGLFSLWRWQEGPATGDWQAQCLTWPLKFTGDGDSADYWASIVAPGEETYEVR